MLSDDRQFCPVCGCELEWDGCEVCDGYGFLDWEDLQEDDPLWYQPGDTERCEACRGKGGWLACPNVPHTVAAARRLVSAGGAVNE